MHYVFISINGNFFYLFIRLGFGFSATSFLVMYNSNNGGFQDHPFHSAYLSPLPIFTSINLLILTNTVVSNT